MLYAVFLLGAGMIVASIIYKLSTNSNMAYVLGALGFAILAFLQAYRMFTSRGK